MLRTLMQLRFPINGYSECSETAEHLFILFFPFFSPFSNKKHK